MCSEITNSHIYKYCVYETGSTEGRVVRPMMEILSHAPPDNEGASERDGVVAQEGSSSVAQALPQGNRLSTKYTSIE
jgi:hypothetical protein